MIRQDIISSLKAKTSSAMDLSITFNRPLSAIEDDLDHIRTTMRYDENYKLLMLPANCQLCGYQFSNKKIKAPSKCPDCRREKITLPQFKIQEK